MDSEYFMGGHQSFAELVSEVEEESKEAYSNLEEELVDFVLDNVEAASRRDEISDDYLEDMLFPEGREQYFVERDQVDPFIFEEWPELEKLYISRITHPEGRDSDHMMGDKLLSHNGSVNGARVIGDSITDL